MKDKFFTNLLYLLAFSIFLLQGGCAIYANGGYYEDNASERVRTQQAASAKQTPPPKPLTELEKYIEQFMATGESQYIKSAKKIARSKSDEVKIEAALMRFAVKRDMHSLFTFNKLGDNIKDEANVKRLKQNAIVVTTSISNIDNYMAKFKLSLAKKPRIKPKLSSYKVTVRFSLKTEFNVKTIMGQSGNTTETTVKDVDFYLSKGKWVDTKVIEFGELMFHRASAPFGIKTIDISMNKLDIIPEIIAIEPIEGK